MQLYVLKWCALYAAKNNQYKNLKDIVYADLSVNEKWELLLFMRDLFEDKFSHLSKAIED